MQKAPQTAELLLYHEPISKTPDGLDEFGIGRIIFNFLAKAVDIYHDGVFIHNGLAPDHCVNHLFWENPVNIVHKQLHNGVFLGGKRNFRAILIKPQRSGIIAEGAGHDASGRSK